jgi:Protein of unknown function (DUF3616)
MFGKFSSDSILLAACLGFLACAPKPRASQASVQPEGSAGGSAQAAAAEAKSGAAASPSPAVGGAAANELVFTGMCDASGAVPLSDTTLLVADDEDNVLRVYDVSRPGPAVASYEFSPALGLPKKGKQGKEHYPEVDIEAATSVGDRHYFLSSHARNASGKLKSERLFFFGTEMKEGNLLPVGEPYANLLEDLTRAPQLQQFHLGEAAALPPKAKGGLNLEGMTARFEGGLWIGFRNPQPAGRALLVPILNPEEILKGQPAAIGEPITLDLGGLGVRSLSSHRGEYLISAGHFDSGAPSQLFRWDGHQRLERVEHLDLSRYNPEAFFTPEGSSRVLLLSDDGTIPINGVDCKRLRDREQKRFRGLWVSVLPTAG